MVIIALRVGGTGCVPLNLSFWKHWLLHCAAVARWPQSFCKILGSAWIVACKRWLIALHGELLKELQTGIPVSDWGWSVLIGGPLGKLYILFGFRSRQKPACVVYSSGRCWSSVTARSMRLCSWLVFFENS